MLSRQRVAQLGQSGFSAQSSLVNANATGIDVRSQSLRYPCASSPYTDQGFDRALGPLILGRPKKSKIAGCALKNLAGGHFLGHELIRLIFVLLYPLVSEQSLV